MHRTNMPLRSGKLLINALAKLSPAERQAIEDSFHDVSSEKTDELETDVTTEFGRELRRALSGRYRIFCKLNGDEEYWNDNHRDFQEYSAHLPHRPDIIAAALAIRPEDKWEWSVVKAWSWVYRHAALLDIDIDDFAEWCTDQDPESSRAFVAAALELPEGSLVQSNADVLPATDTANSNA